MGLFNWLRCGGARAKVPGRIAVKLRKVIRDFDTSDAEGITKLRHLCEQDPEMKRVPEGIESSFFCQLEADVGVAKESKKHLDLREITGLWEANLDWDKKEKRRLQEASAKPVDASELQSWVAKLADTDTDVIYESCRKLKDTGRHALVALPKCIELLTHRDPALRQAAADVIAAIGKPAASASAALEGAKRKETEDWARDSIVHALREIRQ